MEVKELIQKVEEGGYPSVWDAQDEIGFDIKATINPDKHRWYEVTTNVVKCDDGFVGIRGVTKMFSEVIVWSDCNYLCEAFEMVEKQTITYVKK